MVIGYPTIITVKETTPTTFGGDVMNEHQRYKKGINVAATDPLKKVDVGTETSYRSLMLQIWAANLVNKIKFLSPAISNDVQISLPTNLDNAAPNEFLFKDLPTEIKYKVIDTATNSLLDIRNTNIASNAAITDSKLAQITDKAKLSSAIAYKDETSWLTNSHVADATLNWAKLTGIPSAFAPVAHKSSHLFGGGDAFVKGDRLFAASVYLENRTDISSDKARIWLEVGGDDIRYWSDDTASVKHSIATDLNTLTLAAKNINLTNNTVTDTSTALGDLMKSNGTKFLKYPKGLPLQVLRVNAAGTDLEYAAPAATGGDVYLANANNFTAAQKITAATGQLMTFYRPENTGGFGAGFYYNFNDSLNNERTYGFNYVSIEDNVLATLRGDFNVQLAINNILGIRFRIFTSGNGGIIFGNNQRILISETGLTAQRTYTLPDSDQTLVGRTGVATLTNKSHDAAKITNYLNFTKQATAPADPAIEEGELYLKTIDADNNGVFVKHKQGTIMIEEQITPRPLSPFSINDAIDVIVSTPLPNQRIVHNGSLVDPQWMNTAPPPSENPELKTGEWMPITASTIKTGLFLDGLVEQFEATIPVTYGADSKGQYAVFSSNVSVQSFAGLYQTVARYRREYQSKLLTYWIGQSGTSNTTYTIGFSASATLPAGDAPLDSGVQGVFVMLRVADNATPPGTLKIIHNDGTGASNVTDTGVGYVGATHHKVEVHLSSTDVKVYVDDTLITLTTEIPSLTTPLYMYCLARRVGGGAKLMTIYNCKVISK